MYSKYKKPTFIKLQPFVAIIAVTASSAVFAAPLTPRQALERAAADRSCLRAVPGLQTRAGETSLSFTQLTEKGSPAAYVFNVGNQNFMVLSADDTFIPLLAYGENPVEETSLPPNMKQWLSGYASQIEKLTESSGAAPIPSRFASRKTKAAEKAPIAPLLSTKWNQDAPYNLYDESFQWYGEAEDGEYNLVVYDMNTEEIFYSEPCELKTDAGETYVRLNSFSVKGDPKKVNADELTFEIDLDCLSGHFDAPLYIYIWHYDWNKQEYDDDYVKMITVGYDYLDGGENLSLEVKDNFKEGIIGDYYYASLYYYTSDFNELANAGFYVGSSSSGITETEADSVETPVYYDLTGRRAALPLKKGIYIRRAGGKTSKIAVD